MQQEQDTSSLRARMCSMNQVQHHYKRGCAVRIRRIFSTSDDLQYKSGTFSIQTRACSTNRAHHQDKQGCAVQASRSSGFGTGRTIRKYFLMNESLLLLIYQVK